MIRNLRTLGLALIAVLAMGAMVASAAQAEETGIFEWEEGTTLLTGTAEPVANGGTQIFTILGGLTVQCDQVHADVNVTTTESPSSTLTTTGLTYNDSSKGEDKCRGPLGTSPKIEMNGCQYLFHAGETVSEHETQGDVTIECPVGKQIVINGAGCVVTVPGGQTVGPVDYQTITGTGGAKDDVTIKPTVTGITYSTSGFLCGSHSDETDGTYTGTVTVVGKDASGNPTNVEVT